MSPSFAFITRGYTHFDSPISKLFAEKLATDPQRVATHSFYPFIKHDVVTQKIRKKSGGGVELKKPKIRPIAYAAHKDSHIFSHYGSMLAGHYECALRDRGLHEVVTAFRSLKRQRNIHFANEAFEFIQQCGNCAVVITDISDYFGTIDHAKLKAAWCRLFSISNLPSDHYAVFKAITQFCQVNRDKLYKALGLNPKNPRNNRRHRLCSPKEFRKLVRGGKLCAVNRSGKGIPQGSPISAVLSNIYLLEFDTQVNALVSAHAGLYRRYCDDLMIVMPTVELREEILATVREMLKELGLEAHPDKTATVDFKKGGDRVVASKTMNYLGFTFDGKHKRIRPGSIARYYQKMRRGVRRARAIRWRVQNSNPNSPRTPLRRRRLHILYSYVGRHNFISYALQAAKIMKDPGIKKQVKAHWRRLQDLIKQSP